MGRRARERAGGGGLGGSRRWRRTLVAPRGGWTEPPISWAHRPLSHREVAPGGACGGRPAHRRAAAAAARVDRGAGVIEAAQSLPAFRSTSPPPPRGDSERAAALSCLSTGSPRTCAPLRGGHRPLHAPTTLNPPLPGPFVPASRPSPVVVFAPGLERSGLLLPGSALLN